MAGGENGREHGEECSKWEESHVDWEPGIFRELREGQWQSRKEGAPSRTF